MNYEKFNADKDLLDRLAGLKSLEMRLLRAFLSNPEERLGQKDGRSTPPATAGSDGA